MSHVVCLGLATLDTIPAVPRHPGPDDRVVASELVITGGGPAATAAVALARLGVDTFFVGAVGDDEVGRRIRDGLEEEGVDVSELAAVPGARSPQSSILVGGEGRSIVHFRGDAPVLPSERAHRLCRDAAWVHVDHVGYPAVPDLTGSDAHLSIDGGNTIDGLQLERVTVYAPTQAELDAQFGGPVGALEAGAALVVVTRGADGSAAYIRGGAVIEVPAYPVEALSTLGAGDVFHGALVAQLSRGESVETALGVANECAALSCRALDGRSAIPTLEEVAR